MSDCDHNNTPRQPTYVVVKRGYPLGDPPEIATVVACPDCGAPVRRTRFSGVMTHPEWLEEQGYVVPDELPHFEYGKQ